MQHLFDMLIFLLFQITFHPIFVNSNSLSVYHNDFLRFLPSTFIDKYVLLTSSDCFFFYTKNIQVKVNNVKHANQ